MIVISLEHGIVIAKHHQARHLQPCGNQFFCANLNISITMLSSEQILETAAHDGSIDMYAPSGSFSVSSANRS